MDPDACLARLIAAACDGDFEELLWAADDLATWLRRGGFPPRDPTRPTQPRRRRRQTRR
jgi:hypothetical protein